MRAVGDYLAHHPLGMAFLALPPAASLAPALHHPMLTAAGLIGLLLFGYAAYVVWLPDRSDEPDTGD